MKISIIIPNLNDANGLESTLISIFKQDILTMSVLL